MDYDQFIQTKLPKQHRAGFEPGPINPKLFPWQQKIVEWAVRLGRAALFEDCGLGKTAQQLEWARQVAAHTGKPVLILCPLAVAEQTRLEGGKFGIEVTHCRKREDWNISGINVLNYERLHLFEDATESLGGIVLDESSILKDFSGKTTQRLIELFSRTPHRLCCTATPAPNDYEELGTHAEFLGYGTRFEMLATYFIHDSANTSEWRLKKHARNIFWQWVATWAACISKPSDIGFSDEGYDLPALEIKNVQVEVDETDGAGDELFRCPSMSSATMHSEMRKTCEDRSNAAAKIVAGIDDFCVIWCNTNYEADALKKLLPDAVEVRGSDDADAKEEKINRFTTGQCRRIISKSSITGFGLNWQHCCNHVFVGLSYSFEKFYQAMRRGYRFGQKRIFTAWVISAQTEGAVRKALMDKMTAHNALQSEMKIAAKALQFNAKPKLTMKTDLTSHKAETWELVHGDAVRLSSKLQSESVGFSIYSPPFASLYVYSSDPQDMGNCGSDDDFIEQYRYLIKEKFRATMEGRISAVHCADLPAMIWKDGYQGFKDFTADIRLAHEDAGWVYHCRVTIWKDPVVEMQRTKALGLLYKQLRKDSCRSRVGNPDYLLVFRKPGDNANPVEHTFEDYPVDQWQRDASPVWMDIDQTETLSRDGAREVNDEKHICPLQLQTIRRAIKLWSNKNDLVYSPFAGIGSEGYCAIEMGRRFIGSELKKSYFDQAVQYLKKADRESVAMFDFAR